MRVRNPVSQTIVTFRERIVPPLLLLTTVLLIPLQFPNLLRAVESGDFMRMPALIVPLRRLLDLSSSLVILAAAWSIGSLFSGGKIHRSQEAGLEATLDVGIVGLLVLSLVTFGVALAGFLVPAMFGVLLLIVVLRLRGLWEAIRGCGRDLFAYWRMEAQFLGWPMTMAAWFTLAVIGFLVLVSHLYPTTETDATNYHLFPVRTYVETHSWQSLPDNPNFYPEAMEMLYSLAYIPGSQFGARGVHLLFVPLLYALMVVAINRFKLKPVATPALAIFLSVPIVSYVVSDSLTNDLPVAFFLLFALVTLLRWKEEPRGSLLSLAAVSLALALGSKHTAILSIPFFFLFFMVWGGESSRNKFKNGAQFLGLALLMAMTWYGKALAQTGNPLWPTFSGWFTGVYNEFGAELLAATKANYGIWNPAEWYKIPGEMFFGDGVRLDGTLGLFPLVLLIPVVVGGLRVGVSKPLLLFLGAGFLSWLLVVQEVRYLIFLLPPLILSGLSAIGFLANNNAPRVRGRIAKGVIILGTVVLFLSLPIFQNITHNPQRYTPLIQRRFLDPMMMAESAVPIRLQFGPIDEFYLERMLPGFRSVQFINHNLPDTARVFYMGAEPPYLYMRRAMVWDQRSASVRNLRVAESPGEYLTILRRERVSHILFRRSDFPDHWMQNAESRDVRSRMALVNVCNDYILYQILDTPADPLAHETPWSLFSALSGEDQALQVSGDVHGPRPATLLGDTRRAIMLLAGSSVETRLTVPRHAMLSFAVAKLLPGIGDGGKLVVDVLNGEGRIDGVEILLRPRENAWDRSWKEFRIDLRSYAGEEVTLRFVSSVGDSGDAQGDWFAIAEPVVGPVSALPPACPPLIHSDAQ